MDATGLLLPLGVAVIDWMAVFRKWKGLEYLAKPGTMLVLLGWLAWQAARAGVWPAPLVAFALGLVLSLAGDVFLMLPRRFFLPGLVAFLLGHVTYIVALNWTGLAPSALAVAAALAVAGVAFWLARRITASLDSSGQHRLKVPVVAYTAVLSLMVISAIATLARPEWSPTAARLVSLGSLLFMLSDSVLAWDRFVAALPNGRLITMTTYHLGQILLAAGFAIQYLAP